MNKVILLGRLVKDTQLRYGTGENPVAIAKYTLAVDRPYKKEGEQDADFINMVAFGKAGEFADKHFKKGLQVAVVGRLQTGTYDDDKGNKHYFTEVIVEEQHFADSKKE